MPVAEVIRTGKDYIPLPTMTYFHKSIAPIRAIVGPVGSGKTSAGVIEIEHLSAMMFDELGIKHTKWGVIRNTYRELMDTCYQTILAWIPGGKWVDKTSTYTYRVGDRIVELLLRSCDRPDQIKQFKSLELTGYWIDESIEIAEEIKLMIRNRIGRYPAKEELVRLGLSEAEIDEIRFGIETSNPPDVEDPMYWKFRWMTSPPGIAGPITPDGPIPDKQPLQGYEGFWQPPYENEKNLRRSYYKDLAVDYAANPDWLDMYIKGKPGIIIQGKPVYNNFRREYHVAKEPIVWSGGPLYMGWDNTGVTPAAVLLQIPSAMRLQQLREYYTDRMGIVDFTRSVIQKINQDFPGAQIHHWADPAGENSISRKEGGLTSNAQLMRDEGVNVRPSENGLRARIESVEQQLARIDGYLCDPSCTRTINGFLGGYCYPENRSIMGEFLPNIIKNRFSHPHDALQYVTVRLVKPAEIREDIPKEQIKGSRWQGRKRDEAQSDYDPLTHGLGKNLLRRRRWR